MSGPVNPTQRAEVLAEAMPYIRKFRDAIVVVKYGGHAMTDPALASQFAQDIVLLSSVGIKPVVVHGGGPQISNLMEQLGVVPEFKNGHRVTNLATLDVARMVLVGKIGRDIVSSINVHGPLAVGLSGEDAGLILVSAVDPDLGYVGDIQRINPAILQRLLAENLIPVISTIGSDSAGQSYNINADTVAGAIAESLGAEKIIFLTDIEGLMKNVEDPTSLINKASVDDLRSLEDSGAIGTGMIPKVGACIKAVESGVSSAHILDGRLPHVVLLELFTDTGVGTMITGMEV